MYYDPESIVGREAIRVATAKQTMKHRSGLFDCPCAGCQFGDGPMDSGLVVTTQYKRLYDRQQMNEGLKKLAEANAKLAADQARERELVARLAQEQKSRRDFDQRVNSASIKIAKVLKQHGLVFGKVLTQPGGTTGSQHSIEFKQATVVNPLSTFLRTNQINQSK